MNTNINIDNCRSSFSKRKTRGRFLDVSRRAALRYSKTCLMHRRWLLLQRTPTTQQARPQRSRVHCAVPGSQFGDLGEHVGHSRQQHRRGLSGNFARFLQDFLFWSTRTRPSNRVDPVRRLWPEKKGSAATWGLRPSVAPAGTAIRTMSRPITPLGSLAC